MKWNENEEHDWWRDNENLEMSRIKIFLLAFYKTVFLSSSSYNAKLFLGLLRLGQAVFFLSRIFYGVRL